MGPTDGLRSWLMSNRSPTTLQQPPSEQNYNLHVNNDLHFLKTAKKPLWFITQQRKNMAYYSTILSRRTASKTKTKLHTTCRGHSLIAGYKSVLLLTSSFGAGNSILRSIRPGLSSAESRMSILFVAMIT